MANRLIAPSLADVNQDIAGVIPIDIILKWATTKQNLKSHQDILHPHKVTGTVVSSDSTGLSKLTTNKSLLEVMRLVSQPKEIIFQYGKALGGKEIGIWAADNTQMFYPQDIGIQKVLHQMAAAQKEIHSLPVQVGIGVHCATFINIGGGLFGPEADLVETLAESFTEAGEISITKKALKLLDKNTKTKCEKHKNSPQSCYNLDHSTLNCVLPKSKNYNYPYPFTSEFFKLLRNPNKDSQKKAYSKYSKEKIVILVKIVHKKRSYLLSELSDWVLANSILKKITLLDRIDEIKSNGSLGIFVTDNTSQAIEFASDLKDTMAANGYKANVGISKGEVFIFPLSNGAKEIAGGPVNIASKLAEDSGGIGEVLIENSVDIKEHITPKLNKFKINLSALSLKGYKF